jgi:hypothetical protein
MTTTLVHRPAPPATDAYPLVTGYPRVRRVRIVTVPDRRCLAVGGTAAPGGAEFQAAMGALYGTAYSLHFLLRERGVDAHIGPTEALWARRDGASGWSEGDEAFDPDAWRWTLVMPLPEEAADADIDSALAVARRKRPSPALAGMRLMTLQEGLVVEAMHAGPYATEPETIARMRDVADAAGLAAHGPHHEIYLGDPRRCAPENLRTVLRQPVRASAGVRRAARPRP